MELAQVNVARMRWGVEDPRMRGFVAALGRVNALAERAPGFVWRFEARGGHLDGEKLLGDPLVIVNLSVWRSYEDLHDFTYRTDHADHLRRRATWFVPPRLPHAALWWMRAGARPTPEEAVARLRHLRRHGPTPQAFSLRRRFTPDGRLVDRGRTRLGA